MGRIEIREALQRVTAALPGGGEARAGQQEMAEAVADAIVKHRNVVVQAGTGTGKSIGYLVPALLSGQRVVVATATKALQDQLAGKDLPFLREHLGVPFEFALLKGRSNYFCWQRARELGLEGAQLELDGLNARALEDAKRLIIWAGTTDTGDRAELDVEPSEAAWGAVSVSAGECPGAAKCPSGETCFAEAARRRAALADVIVVNMHLYGLHVASGGYVLPDHDVVVFDEAHAAEDIFADCLAIEISGGRFSQLAGRFRSVVAAGRGETDHAATLGDAGGRIEDALEPLTGQLLRAGPGADERLRSVLTLAVERLNSALSVLRKVPDDAGGGVGPKKVRAVQAATSLLAELIEASELGAEPTRSRTAIPIDDDIIEVKTTRAEVDRVAWVQAGGSTRGPSLCIAPVEVGPLLAARLWESTTAILTSATIPMHLIDRLGLPPERTSSLDVGSPFDFATQALLYCAVNLPDPRHARYEAEMHNELEALIRAAGGRTLALFTSWRAMKAAATAMLERDLPGRILAQGERPKPALTRAFAEDETSSLFATMGFWQGIDVPGRALSLVAIDKLPFSRPDEPLLVARRERAGSKAFETIDLPRAATLLAQGAGRLIRSRSDRGVVAVLDPRLNTARYRWDLIRALPPMARTRRLDDVIAFLKNLDEPMRPPAPLGPTPT